MNILLNGKSGDSSQLTEHCRFIGGIWYSSPEHLPNHFKKYEKLWQGVSPEAMTPKPPTPALKNPKKKPNPETHAAATIAAIQSNTPCINC